MLSFSPPTTDGAAEGAGGNAFAFLGSTAREGAVSTVLRALGEGCRCLEGKGGEGAHVFEVATAEFAFIAFTSADLEGTTRTSSAEGSVESLDGRPASATCLLG